MKNVKKLMSWTICQNGEFQTAPLAFGPDQIYIFDASGSDGGHEKTILSIKALARVSDIPLVIGGRIKRLEDVKKYLYAGGKSVLLDSADEGNIDLIKEAADRFGGEKIGVLIAEEEKLKRIEEFFLLGASKIVIEADLLMSDTLTGILAGIKLLSNQELYFISRQEVLPEDSCLQNEQVNGMILAGDKHNEDWYVTAKELLKKQGFKVKGLESAFSFSDFKLNEDDLIPVIVQDYKTDEVLMLAYMNEEAFENTIRTGRMTYYSRSRQSQWVKGETSGHFQYVKALALDCDKDTILAKVMQIGPACHTGAKSCFFNELAKTEYLEKNPLKVFSDVYDVIADRKKNPKVGSYTNYLFDKGVDKILKKVGEEATEIIIAAKNPDPEEIKYEISDFLYHAMVLMVEKGVSWDDIMEELANR